MNAMLQPETPQQAARRIAAKAIQDGYEPDGLFAYQDADGNVWCYRIRCKHPDGRKWIRPMWFDGSQYVVGEPPRPAEGKPLYHLPELLAADPDALVVIVEGEPMVKALTPLGIIATTSGSADSAAAADWTPLRGHIALMWPDNDKAGRKYRDDVIAKLRAQGCAVDVIDVDKLNLPDKGDCVDWLAMYPDAIAADVLALPLVPASAVAASDCTPRIELRCASDIVCRPISWLWPGWMARGKVHILAGAPGTGKTTIALAFAAAVSSGGHWPSGMSAPVGNVLIWSGEDDAADTIVPRLKAAGADLSRVFIVGDYRAGEDARPFDPADDMDLLEREAERIGSVALLIADPVVSAVTGDSHKNTEVRRALQPIVDLAMRLDAAVLGITHFSKGTAGKDPTERVTGSVAFGAIARVVLVTAKRVDEASNTRLLARSKSNIGPDGGGFVYELEQVAYDGLDASRVRWGASLDGTAKELLGDAETEANDPSKNAAGFLRELLAGGSRPAKEIYRDAEGAGYSRDAMKRAKAKIGAGAIKLGMKEGWAWRLRPLEGSEQREESSHKNGASFAPFGEKSVCNDDLDVPEL